MFFLIALATIPVYQSGVAAAETFKGQTAVAAAIALHQDVALQSFVLVELTGFLSWLALWQIRRVGKPSTALVGTITLLSVLAMAVVALAANLGGDIHHPGDPRQPILSSPITPTAFVMIKSATVTQFVLQNRGYDLRDAALPRHVADVRRADDRQPPPPQLHEGDSVSGDYRLLPWGILGYGVNFFTGMLFFIGESGQYAEPGVFTGR